MEAIFGATLNTRPLLEGSLKYIRSDAPTLVSEKERLWLIEKGITTVVDLRTERERLVKGCPLETDSRFVYHSIAVTDGDIIPENTDSVSKSYIHMVDEAMQRIIDTICNAQSNVLYFCTAGKDRTGVVSAILLLKEGQPLDYIVADYMKSRDNLKEAIEAYVRLNPDIDINVLTPRERYIREFLGWYLNERV